MKKAILLFLFPLILVSLISLGCENPVPVTIVEEPTDPDPTDPGTTDPDPTDPGTTDPDPTDPGTTDPDPTDPDPTDPDPVDPLSFITGNAAKGPFTPGSTVTIFTLDDQFNQVGTSYFAEVEGSLGSFSITGLSPTELTGTVILKTEGTFRDENTGEISTDSILLTSLAELGDNSRQITILSSIVKNRVLQILKDSSIPMDLAAAEDQALAELLTAIGLSYSPDMILTLNDSPELALISSTFCAYGSPTDIQTLIGRLASDLQLDGNLNDSIDDLNRLTTIMLGLNYNVILSNLIDFGYTPTWSVSDLVSVTLDIIDSDLELSPDTRYWSLVSDLGLVNIQRQMDGLTATVVDVTGADKALTFYNDIDFYSGMTYTLRFDGSATTPRHIGVGVQMRNLKPWAPFSNQYAELTTVPQSYEFVFSIPEDFQIPNNNATLFIAVGQLPGEYSYADGTISIENVSLSMNTVDPQTTAQVEMLRDSNFTLMNKAENPSGSQYWWVEGFDPGKVVNDEAQGIDLEVTDLKSEGWEVAIGQSLLLSPGVDYEIEMSVTSSVDRYIELVLQEMEAPYYIYSGEQFFNLPANIPQTITTTVSMPAELNDDDYVGSFVVNLGNLGPNYPTAIGNINIDYINITAK